MKKISLFILTLAFMVSCSSTEVLKTVDSVLGAVTEDGALTNDQIGMGLKEALTQGITKGVSLTSKQDGFFKNPQIKIPWPAEAIKVENTLRGLGINKEVDQAILSINRAAENAATKAKPIFVDAIKQLTFQDVMNILKGNDNAATDFLRRTTSTKLTTAFKPVISNSLDQVDATKHWESVFTAYNKVPLTKKVDTDLEGYVTGKALDGLFLMVEKEEKLIRKDPIARGTELLKKVFALQDTK